MIKHYIPENYLEHHGIKGQKWGVRRYQYYDGTLTPLGEKRYAIDSERFKRYADVTMRNRNIAKDWKETAKADYKWNNFLLKRTREKSAKYRSELKKITNNDGTFKDNKKAEKLTKKSNKAQNKSQDLTKRIEAAVNLKQKSESLLKETDKQYKEMSKYMIEKYGYQNVKSLLEMTSNEQFSLSRSDFGSSALVLEKQSNGNYKYKKMFEDN